VFHWSEVKNRLWDCELQDKSGTRDLQQTARASVEFLFLRIRETSRFLHRCIAQDNRYHERSKIALPSSCRFAVTSSSLVLRNVRKTL
jgi:hypothetical protein